LSVSGNSYLGSFFVSAQVKTIRVKFCCLEAVFESS
jgi:hypothetical protein